MRTVAIGVYCVLLAGAARAECVEVEPQESSSHIRIAVVLGGRPLKGVKVDFHPTASQPAFSELTDDDGIAAPKEIALGNYAVVATLHDVVSTSLWLQVAHEDGVTKFSMDLTEQVERAERLPVHDHLKAFQGTVVDPTGAIIPAANILVVKKGSHVQDIVLKAKAEANGHFSAQLAESSYIAFFFTQGFRVAIVPLEVTKDGSGDLKVALTIGHC